MQKKAQHTVPKSYLRAWCDPGTPNGAFVWIFPKEGGQGHRRSPKSTFIEEDFYTLTGPGGQRDLSIEDALAKIEGAFVAVRDGALKERRLLTDIEKTDLCAYVGAMLTRTTSFTEHWRRQWSDVLLRMEDLERTLPKVDPAPRRKPRTPLRPGTSMGIEEVRALTTLTAQFNVTTMIPPLTTVLCAMNLTILETNSEPGFITSDAPGVWFDPKAHLMPWPYNGHGLASPTIEVSMPISPRQAAWLTWRLNSGYIQVPDTLVVEANRMLRAYCHRFFVVSRDATKAQWFDLVPPGFQK